MPSMLFARRNGEMMDFPGLSLLGRSGRSFLVPREEDLIPLPEGATLTLIPGRRPVGLNRQTRRVTVLNHNPYEKRREDVWAVGALLPQGFSRTFLPAFSEGTGDDTLPLLGYTAVGVKNGRFYVAAVQTDDPYWWNPCHFNTEDLESHIVQKKAALPRNRIISQLSICALEYGCFTAQNIFYGRWEGGLPVSPVCNARCLGCISSQPSECCPAPQRRLNFVPSLDEVVEVAVSHLQQGKKAIVSFGQGCEGEPSMESDLISRAIEKIRQETSQGTININTNAGDTKRIQKIVDAGVDTIRVSLISPNPDIYHRYYRPRNYRFPDVVSSLKYASQAGVYVSLNLLTFPGVTDDRTETARLIELIQACGVHKVQLRNLNIDPKAYLKLIPGRLNPIGIPAFINRLKQEIPGLDIGSFSRPVT